jgi:hypothetical protein
MIDSTKLARQDLSSIKWRNAGGIGTLNLVMRFGKTLVALLAINKMLVKNDKVDIVIVTPSVAVKQEWEDQITKYSIIEKLPEPYTLNQSIVDYIRVYTANQVIDEELKITCDLLIIDEVHRFTSDKRIRLLRKEIINNKYLMCLTGSMPGGDMRSKIVSYAPIVDIITEEEALKNGWISSFIEFNVPLEFPENDKLEYRHYSNIIKDVLKKFKDLYKKFRWKDGSYVFNNDFDLIIACYSGKSTVYRYMKAEEVREGIRAQLSWNTDLANEWTDEYIKDMAYKFNKSIAKRNDLLVNSIVKLNAVLTIFKNNPVSTICFNESTSFADVICDAINNNIKRCAICYHSNIATAPMIDPITGTWILYGERSVRAGEIKKFGKDSVKKLAIEGMRDGTYTFLSTARALDEGLTIASLEQVITTAGTANPMQYSQRSARGKTVDIYNLNKVTKIYNLYFDDFKIINEEGEVEFVKSRDKTKLYLRQSNNRNDIVTLNLIDLIE